MTSSPFPSFQHESLLDQQFLDHLSQHHPNLLTSLQTYRHTPSQLSPLDTSALLLNCAPILEHFLIHLFNLHSEIQAARQLLLEHNLILEFKKRFVLRKAKRRLKDTPSQSFDQLNQWLNKQLIHFLNSPLPNDLEKATAQLAHHYLTDQQTHADEIEQLTCWCIQALRTPEGQAHVQHWVSFQLPQPLQPHNLVPTISCPRHGLNFLAGPLNTRRQRQGFTLTDARMTARQVQGELHYCIYCHQHQDDFCARGFPEKKEQHPPQFKSDPLGNILTGCPLEQKISEAHLLKSQGYPIAALAMIMINNPFCAVTGHRVCNDCLKSCIYQKQTPVNIPQIETRILTDVLSLPWGVEIYDLLMRWHPLRATQHLPKPYNGLKILIAGQGPAGFTLAHHLLMEGFAVVGIEGLKIEPLPSELIHSPIRDYNSLVEALDDRISLGFGGVTEYGITVRWDKNFLKLIYLSLLRRPYFQLYGNVRFGGTITVEKAWELGFDHVAIAVGAGLPQALNIPNSLAPGMRQASDFLMTLQSQGAARKNSLTRLQIRLPALVIGGGLTAIDTSTELQAYYLTQIEKIQHRYQILSAYFGEEVLRADLDSTTLNILDEFLNHAQALKREQERALLAGDLVNVQKLLQEWGGVTVIYRRSLQQSPAYTRNHEEIIKALEEGIFYLESLEPIAVHCDDQGQVAALVCQPRAQDAEGQWQAIEPQVILPARSILVATGAKPNIAYEFEHRGHFEREGFQYQPYQQINGNLTTVSPTPHCKTETFGPFTSYHQQGRRVSFVGDTHPTFHGSVVKAIASGLRSYPAIVDLFRDRLPALGDSQEYLKFRQHLQHALTARLINLHMHHETALELQIQAPLAAQQYQAGQIFRLQNFAHLAPLIKDTHLQMEPLAIRCAGVDTEQGILSFIILGTGTVSQLCQLLQPGQPIALMGPSGVKTQIPQQKTIMIIGGELAAIYLLGVASALRAAGNRLLYIATFPDAQQIFRQADLEAAAEVIIWITAKGLPLSSHRSQDYAETGNMVDILSRYAEGQIFGGNIPIPLQSIDRVLIIGEGELIKTVQQAAQNQLHTYFAHHPQFIASVHGPMQCMLKGVCAQCLQWQIDPTTGQRTKAVFACSWQDQPLNMIDLENLQERLSQNRLQEYLNARWLEYLGQSSM